MKKIFFFLVLLLSVTAFAQQADFLKLKRYQKAYLSDTLRENSGLHFFKNRLFTFNDGGNTSDLFEIDKASGKILKILPTNLENKDWEAITGDSLNLFIGDFGNNAGMRKDLKIYKIPFQDSLRLQAVQTLPFYYPEQTDFSRRLISNDFDGEAMVYAAGKIHLFTKEWLSKSVTHYTIDPDHSENQPAQKMEVFKTGFVVTDAALFDGKLYLIGYTKKTEVFLQIFSGGKDGLYFGGTTKKYYLGTALSLGQIEGIAVDATGMYISGEAFNSPLGKSVQKLYFVPASKLRFP